MKGESKMIELNVYDEDDVIVKTCESKEIDLRFGMLEVS